jgi:hypothetical protein
MDQRRKVGGPGRTTIQRLAGDPAPRLPRSRPAPVLAWYDSRGGVRRVPAVGPVEEIARRVRQPWEQ